MRETEIVDRIRSLSARQPFTRTLVKGIGDDCAILRPRANDDLVFTCDFVLEGRHFNSETHKPEDVGHKALTRSLSDLAAMGSEPVFCLVSLAVPETAGSKWIGRFYKGLLALAAKYNVVLAGGDLARFEKTVADVTCCGRVPRGKALLRSGAKPRDEIYVTGQLGGSALGFASRTGRAWRRHLRPEARIEAGLALRRIGATAAMDLSDGLSLDLQRLCVESKVSALIDADVPVFPGATTEQALHGGEDYELLFTASARTKVPKKIGKLPVTRIGVIGQGLAGEVLYHGFPLQPKGFDHFA